MSVRANYKLLRLENNNIIELTVTTFENIFSIDKLNLKNNRIKYFLKS